MNTLLTAITAQAPQHTYFFIMAPGTEHLLDCSAAGTVVPSNAKYYSITEQFEIPGLLRQYKVDLFHALHFAVPVIKVSPTVVTIHDTIHLVYPTDIKNPIGRFYAKVMLRIAARVADRILTVSTYSKEDIVRFLGVIPDKVRVTYAALDSKFVPVRDENKLQELRVRYGLKKNPILYAGIFRERKNHMGLLKAFAVAVHRGLDAQLVIAGALKEGTSILTSLAQSLGVAERVVFTGFVPDEDLAGLYSCVSAYACPSLYEGFGLTLIEAMACGVPVVCHRGTSLPEVGGSAVLMADANNAEDFASQLITAIENPVVRQEMIERGCLNAQRFRPERLAELTLTTYEELLASKVVAS